MKHFDNILVVLGNHIDPAQNPALARGAALAQKYRARLTLMDVITIPEHAVIQYKGIIKAKELKTMFKKQREEQLHEVAEQLDKSLDISVTVAVGHDFIEIIRQMVFAKHDLLIKMANDHGQGFDSSDFHIMRKCPKPVWLLKPGEHMGCRKILAAVDLALEDTKEGRQLNTAIMDLATALAGWEAGELQVLSCWSLYGEKTLRHSAFLRVSEEQIATLLQKEENSNQSRLDALLARYSDTQINARLLKGNPVDCIPSCVAEDNIDTVVMGTVGRTGIPGLFIGNTSETILHSINASVITLKPDGFESPVKA